MFLQELRRYLALPLHLRVIYTDIRIHMYAHMAFAPTNVTFKIKINKKNKFHMVLAFCNVKSSVFLVLLVNWAGGPRRLESSRCVGGNREAKSIFEASAKTEKVDFENPRESCAFSKGKAQDSRNAPGELGRGPSTPRILEVHRRESRSEINFLPPVAQPCIASEAL